MAEYVTKHHLSTSLTKHSPLPPGTILTDDDLEDHGIDDVDFYVNCGALEPVVAPKVAKKGKSPKTVDNKVTVGDNKVTTKDEEEEPEED